MLDVSDFLNDSFDSEDYVKQTKSSKRNKQKGLTRKIYEGRDLTGPEKNAEGREMARIIFALDKKRFPTEEELRDYAKDLTEGHLESINDYFDYRVEIYLGQKYIGKSPYALMPIVEKLLKVSNN